MGAPETGRPFSVVSTWLSWPFAKPIGHLKNRPHSMQKSICVFRTGLDKLAGFVLIKDYQISTKCIGQCGPGHRRLYICAHFFTFMGRVPPVCPPPCCTIVPSFVNCSIESPSDNLNDGCLPLLGVSKFLIIEITFLTPVTITPIIHKNIGTLSKVKSVVLHIVLL